MQLSLHYHHQLHPIQNLPPLLKDLNLLQQFHSLHSHTALLRPRQNLRYHQSRPYSCNLHQTLFRRDWCQMLRQFYQQGQ
jgi:hypothetical protein